MSSMRAGILGAIAVSASFGAIQLAFGHDLASGFRASFSVMPTAGVNRAAKADRGAAAVTAAMPMQTISIHVDRVAADTSVLVRIPRPQEARNQARAPTLIQSEERKATVACEPVVSVLTEIAKRLQPGRCVT
jgi:hypothetical protein